MKAHPTALVDPAASVADDVEIGPFCVIGGGVKIGPGCRLGARVALQGSVLVGRDNVLHAHVTVGQPKGGRIEIGDANVFRESSHVDAATGATTRIGSRNRLGSWAGVSSGSTVGDDVRLGAFSTVGENGIVEDDAWIEGQCVLDANRRVGRSSLIRSQVPVGADVPPYMCIDGNPFEVQGVNPRRRSSVLDMAFEIAFKSGLSTADAARTLVEKLGAGPEVEALAGYLRTSKPPEAALE
jgi:UDP-N-acetylglucosamine acyltransferase